MSDHKLFSKDYSIGVDIEEISRFENRLYPKYNHLYKRIFTWKEIEYCLSFKYPASHFAVNFAGKEAICKAICSSQNVKLSDIEILRGTKGEPIVNLCSKDFNASSSTKIQIKLSLSHTRLYAIAFAIVCC